MEQNPGGPMGLLGHPYGCGPDLLRPDQIKYRVKVGHGVPASQPNRAPDHPKMSPGIWKMAGTFPEFSNNAVSFPFPSSLHRL